MQQSNEARRIYDIISTLQLKKLDFEGAIWFLSTKNLIMLCTVFSISMGGGGGAIALHVSPNSLMWFIKFCIHAPACSLTLLAVSFIPHEILCSSQIEQFLGHFKHQGLSHLSLFFCTCYSPAWNHHCLPVHPAQTHSFSFCWHIASSEKLFYKVG